ncbi:MAG: TRAP transporter small permease [Candidatus Aminicenantes bacterium]|nr:MAG: TRAP transporter small permease [Candidatus Aminicenantes bacterium]
MRFIRKITEIGIIFLFLVLVAVVFYQVVARYIFNDPPSWTEELARYCQVWVILLTSSICIRKGSHLAVDYFGHRFSSRAKRIINIVMSMLIALYVLVITIFGWKLMVVGQYQLSPALQVKMSFVYIIFPLSGVLMLLEAIIKTTGLIRERSLNSQEN